MIDTHTLTYIDNQELQRLRALYESDSGLISLFTDACRINTLYMISKAGSGHVGSSLSAMDIVSLLYLELMNVPDKQHGDVFFSSKGHDVPGLYSVMLGLNMLPFDKIHALRRLSGLPGHPDVGTSHIKTNTGSLGMGIAKAKGMAIADRLDKIARKYYVLLGDGELQEGQFWESLQPTANNNFSEITAIVDHNKLQSDTFVDEVSSLGDLEARVRAHGWAVARCDGHDFAALRKSFQELETHKGQPKLLIADTVKASGGGLMESTHFMRENRLYNFHSGAPNAEDYMQAIEGLAQKINETLMLSNEAPLKLNSVARTSSVVLNDPHRLVAAYSDALVEQGEKNKKMVALDADLALDTGLLAFEKRWPARFVECGIAEQDMVSTAGGLALNGYLPMVHSFACFLSTRPNEQIYNNATENSKIIYVGSLVGLLPAGPGHSHQSVRDISVLSAIPNILMIEPSCEQEVGVSLDYLVNKTSSNGYLRLVSIPCELSYQLPADYSLEMGKGVTLVEGDGLIMFSYGPVMLEQAVRAAKLLDQQCGLKLKVVNLPWLNYVDPAWLADVIEGATAVLTLDNHYIKGGQGEMILAALANNGLLDGKQTYQFGLTEVPKCGQNDEVMRAHGLDAASLVDGIMALLKV